MTDVGVRELKRDLSGYLKRAAAGELIRVTVHGRPTVELTPVRDPEDPVAARFRELEAQGRLTRAKVPKEQREPLVVEDFGFARSPLEILLEDRDQDR